MYNTKTLVVGTYTHKKAKNPQKIFCIILSIIILLGIIYQKYSISFSANDYGRVGHLIKVNDKNMHLYTSGSGNFTFVLTADIGVPSPYVSLYPLHSKLSEIASVAVYDKPGYGWSELTNKPRDIDTIASEIHSLLNSSGQNAPYVLVAHAMGSLEMLRFAQLYPEEVAGIVLIDGASPEFCMQFNNIMITDSFLLNLSRNLGLLRLGNKYGKFQDSLSFIDEVSPSLQTINQNISLEKLWNRNMIEEKLKLKKNANVILASDGLEDIPLYIITSKANPYSNWNKTQAKMLELSSKSTQSYIRHSSNYIEQSDIPDILEAIHELTDSLNTEEE